MSIQTCSCSGSNSIWNPLQIYVYHVDLTITQTETCCKHLLCITSRISRQLFSIYHNTYKILFSIDHITLTCINFMKRLTSNTELYYIKNIKKICFHLSHCIYTDISHIVFHLSCHNSLYQLYELFTI